MFTFFLAKLQLPCYLKFPKYSIETQKEKKKGAFKHQRYMCMIQKFPSKFSRGIFLYPLSYATWKWRTMIGGITPTAIHFICKIREKVKLSRKYTHHSICALSIPAMDEAGTDSSHFTRTSAHTSEAFISYKTSNARCHIVQL